MQVWNQMDQNSISNMLHRMIIEGTFQGDRNRWKTYADLLYIYASDQQSLMELKPFMERESAFSQSHAQGAWIVAKHGIK